MARKPKYSQEDIQGMLNYAKENKIGVHKMLELHQINHRTFYLMCYRYNLNTDEVRVAEPFNTRLTSAGKINQIIEYAKANRIAHKKACDHFGLCYSTFRGAIARLHIKVERYANTYSKEDVQRVIDYARANHVSMAEACRNFNYKNGLISTLAKRYNIKLDKNLEIFEEANAFSNREFVRFYMLRGYKGSEIHSVMQRIGRKLSRQAVFNNVHECIKEDNLVKEGVKT